MLDFDQLNMDYANEDFYALQLEVGDKCYQGCIYCYMNAVAETKNELTDEIISAVLADAKELGFSTIEWLGGEPLLRQNIFWFMEEAKELGLKNNMWTGGLPFADLKTVDKTAELCENGYISIHLSTLNPELYKIFHPQREADDIAVILRGIEHLLKIGYLPAQILNSVTFTGLQTADDLIATMEFFYHEYQIQTSINVYHTYLRPGYSQEELLKFVPKPEEVQKVYNRYRDLVKADNLPMNCVNKQYCATTVAVLNNGFVTPCATIREEKVGMNVKDGSFRNIVSTHRDYLSFRELKAEQNLPAGCQKCGMKSQCWGCRSRSYAAGNGLYGKDPRCFRS
ncbi:MAG: radical SAM protein [Firmicutes bacterium]|nr:radical SAM protein [Bacillota bacterium]